MCGIVGCFDLGGQAAQAGAKAITRLGHRGQEGAGGVSIVSGELRRLIGAGLVAEVITPELVDALAGSQFAMFQTRYSTVGISTELNIQPLMRDTKRFGIVVVIHNGTITNFVDLCEDIGATEGLGQKSDTTIIFDLLDQTTTNNFEEALVQVACRLQGAFSLIVLHPNNGNPTMYALRDPHGFRPLVYGESGYGGSPRIVFASEDVTLTPAGVNYADEVSRGHMVVVTTDTIRSVQYTNARVRPAKCICEMIYLADIASHIFGRDVYRARIKAGARLAQEMREAGHQYSPNTICVPILNSGLASTIGYTNETGLPMGIGVNINPENNGRREFIQPDTQGRTSCTSGKHVGQPSILSGRDVRLGEDTIIRGKTTGIVAPLVRSCGATSVAVDVAAPPHRHPCYYGLDLTGEGEFVANGIDSNGNPWPETDIPKRVAETIGADEVVYLSGDGMRETYGDARRGISCTFCDACITGNYDGLPLPRDCHQFRAAAQMK